MTQIWVAHDAVQALVAIEAISEQTALGGAELVFRELALKGEGRQPRGNTPRVRALPMPAYDPQNEVKIYLQIIGERAEYDSDPVPITTAEEADFGASFMTAEGLAIRWDLQPADDPVPEGEEPPLGHRSEKWYQCLNYADKNKGGNVRWHKSKQTNTRNVSGEVGDPNVPLPKG